ncbi:hypothetical protein CHS0354_028424 [Potamilus streckersoni]|uniref:Lysophospholipid acyltransferase 7 n=1 Tax=Potamilus streckersoni TaxID=2493646 RepID=A0AAE0VV83_9BIVA|nr:hypothetical protein CHS0354_028424 [Potamilus streckersoni]
MSDDLIYGSVLLFSLAFGQAAKCTKGALNRKLLCSIVGALIVIVTCRADGLHPIFTTFVNSLLISVISPRICHVASFIWCFGYLVFFRTADYFGLPKPSPLANALQLFNTLRMVGVAFEVHDAYYLERKRDESDEDFKRRKEYYKLRPSLLDLVMYSFCYIGLFTGPYYKYRTYFDFLHQEKPESIPTFKFALQRLKPVPAIAISYLVFSYFFNIKYVETEEFYQLPFIYRLLYMVPMFTIFRTRLYLAWLFAECMCMTSGLGAYPISYKAQCGEGPSNLEAVEKRKLTEKSESGDEERYDFETVYNLDIYGCELAPTTREGLRSWNMTVQYWLASCVHRRLPKSLGALRVAVTMGVSAFWHGIHAGYYLSFMTVPPILMAEEAMTAAFRNRANPAQQKLFDWGCWFFKMRGFDYMCMGFLLLKFDATIAYWSSIYFAGHICIVLLLIIGYAFQGKKSKKE